MWSSRFLTNSAGDVLMYFTLDVDDSLYHSFLHVLNAKYVIGLVDNSNNLSINCMVYMETIRAIVYYRVCPSVHKLVMRISAR